MSVGVALVIVALMILVTVMNGEENVAGNAVIGVDANTIEVDGVRLINNGVQSGGRLVWVPEADGAWNTGFLVNTDGSLSEIIISTGEATRHIPSGQYNDIGRWSVLPEGSTSNSDGTYNPSESFSAGPSSSEPVVFTEATRPGPAAPASMDLENPQEGDTIEIYYDVGQLTVKYVWSDSEQKYVPNQQRTDGAWSSYEDKGSPGLGDDSLSKNLGKLSVEKSRREHPEWQTAPTRSSSRSGEPAATSGQQTSGDPLPAAQAPEPAPGFPLVPAECGTDSDCVKYADIYYMSDGGSIKKYDADDGSWSVHGNIPSDAQLQDVRAYNTGGDFTNVFTYLTPEGKQFVRVQEPTSSSLFTTINLPASVYGGLQEGYVIDIPKKGTTITYTPIEANPTGDSGEIRVIGGKSGAPLSYVREKASVNPEGGHLNVESTVFNDEGGQDYVYVGTKEDEKSEMKTTQVIFGGKAGDPNTEVFGINDDFDPVSGHCTDKKGCFVGNDGEHTIMRGDVL